MIDRMWLLLTFGPLLWMALIAAVFGWKSEASPWVRTLVLYSKALCINIGVISVWMLWFDKAAS
jgi:hypothetical protein